MAKHWKQLLKQEVTTKKQVKEEENEDFSLSDLIQPNVTNDEQSLDDIAASNINLKSLLEEQKELEQNMNALTGKTAEHSSSKKQYDSEIKSVYQKRKDAKKEEEKKNKLLKKRKSSTQENINWNKKGKNFFSVDTTRKTQNKIPSLLPKKKNIEKQFIKKQQPKTVLKNFEKAKKIAKNITTLPEKFLQINSKKTKTSKELKKINNILNTTSKISKEVDKNITKFSDELVQINKRKTKVSEGIKKTTNTIDTASKTIKKVITITHDASQGLHKISSLLSDTLDKKEKTTGNKKDVLENKTFSTITETASKIIKTAKKTQVTFNKIDSKRTAFIKTIAQQKENGFKNTLPTIKSDIKDTNALSENLNKVNNFYNNTKKHLEKTNKTVKTVDNLLTKTNQLKKPEKKQDVLMTLNSLDKIFTKKEEKESKGFDTINVSEIFSAAKKIKEFADELPTKKKSASKKDPFSL
ncbi:hypothetical protein H0I31_12165 [Tenacibaculum sp. AHE15PA]|uniref:hypothetical protein n=1 Tax=Tenacibaculum TaxID=104267 RepID=UPI001C4EED3B|nr:MULTISPECIES: hypothetical protein [Tenacibaculum]QXP73714.1 hypothetical protein H0I30_00815 [Tenacibaculum sp. AHE14PA]QXP75919.1 hypothetical protein H0I31_12165 [Tenacibaculum sp. AHE15PA]